MGPASAEVYGRPSESVAVVGVTGTNGKTTVVTLLAEVLRRAGRRCEVIGTLTGARTTPEAPELQARLAECVATGVDVVAMEVSSHALALHRIDGTRFRVGVFTNLGTDHLDFHGTPEAYFAAKAALFEPARCEVGVVNLDDPHGRLLRDAAEIPIVGWSVESLGDLHLGPRGATFTWRGLRVELPMPGRHNVANALAVAEIASLLGLDDAEVLEGLAAGAVVPGRFEVVEGEGATVVVDYAHTPDALRSVLGTARELLGPRGRLLAVFGCGGDRDASKRPAMGRVACEIADEVVLTNDNPRSEDPLRIIEEIRSGCSGAPLVLPDRRSAIRAALASADVGDVVVIAGKGHEQGQQFAERSEPFDDRTVAAEERRALYGGAA
jgi:UDP-N-acetylmuramoyl-L-alanyl-D-glutamate--2,6-diaminopimelate ligase